MRSSCDGSTPLQSCLVPIYMLVFLSVRYLLVTIHFESLSAASNFEIRSKTLASHFNGTGKVTALKDLVSPSSNSTSLSMADKSETSPLCQPRFLSNDRKIERIFFLHMRKAAGSTIRPYLFKVAKAYNLTLEWKEGKNTLIKPESHPNTLYITNFREPIARVISNYKYSVRWDCKDLLKPGFTPSLNNTRGVSLQEFVETSHASKQILWDCGSNCFTRWASSIYDGPDPCSMGTNDERFQIGRDMLHKFHLIIDSDRLDDQNYTRGIEQMFNVSGLTGRHYSMWCGPQSDVANSRFPLEISTETRERIEACNRADLSLHTEFATCPDGVEFPKFQRYYFA